ncbi:DUF4097 family beta strand repeat-containing protein [uncultured Flavobacterium sp.]|uniref:DUF4097 family beta strand repeat-containing protein n=1 Tax=uncultured Flavobacterium sp. TaxID=165435 RepID=UPI0025DC8794|nr:DUF4097 family beta strand repeat-containing protein [uncultured Flavobacterium sp.]
MTIARLNILLLLVAFPAMVFAGGDGNGSWKGKITKEKKLNRSYAVNSTAGLDINNKYGSIYVTTWDENQTVIDVTIKVNGNKEDLVMKRLNSIDVNFDATKALVSARTIIGNFSGRNISMEINYTIKIPKKGSIDLNNQYGNTMVGKIYGRSAIRCQYGDLSIDELNSESNALNLQYSGTSKINYIRSGSVNAQYSGFNVTKAGSLALTAQYTGMTVGEVGDITYKTEYGDMNIKRGGTITGTGEYSAQRFGYVTNQLNATCSYGEVKVGGMDDNVRNVTVNASYTSVNIMYNNAAPFDFELSTEYGGISGVNAFKFTDKREKDNKLYYKGYYKSSGVNKIFVRTKYGDINLTKG